MMRVHRIVILMLSMSLSGSVHALEASDTMTAWKNASAAEKGVIIDKVLSGQGTINVMKCVDAASDAPGHGDLPIAQIIKACDKAGNEPV